MAFPRLNMLSFWTTFLAFIVILAAFFVPGGAPISGWTAYPPLSGIGQVAGPGEGWGQTMWIVSIALFCGASLMGALNFIATIIDLARPGHDADAHAAHLLGLVRHRHPRLAGIRRVARCGSIAFARSFRRHQLLRSGFG